MGQLENIRNKLAAKVFTSSLASTVNLEEPTSIPVDKWGDNSTITYATATNVLSIPYDYIKKQLSYQPFGDRQQGQTDIMFPYTVTITEFTKVTYDSTTYKVIQISPITINNGVAATLVRLQKV
jgi:hypothetical protein